MLLMIDKQHAGSPAFAEILIRMMVFNEFNGVLCTTVLRHPLTVAKKAGKNAGIKLSIPPFYATDGHGLYLEIRSNGSKLWRYRYRIAGRENIFAIGAYPAVSLQEARKARDEARGLVKQGIHPSHARQETLVKQFAKNVNTFESIAREWLDRKADIWSAYSHRQATTCLERNAFPKIGKLPIRSVMASHILGILQEMEKRGAETYAIQLRQWCSAIFRHAVVTLRADHDPSTALKGAVHRPKINHGRPMTREQIGQFKFKLAAYGGNRTTVIALQMLLHTFVRYSWGTCAITGFP